MMAGMVVQHSPLVVLTYLVALRGSQGHQKKIWMSTRERQLAAGVISHRKGRAKGGGLKNSSGGIAEVEEGTGGTLENRVVGGQIVWRINWVGQVDGRGLKEGKQVAGEETGDRETLHLDVAVVMGKVESEATLMRDPRGVI